MKLMKHLLALLLAAMGLISAAALAEDDAGTVARSPVLDAAFSMLEEGNPFLTKYNELTGAGIEARFAYGLPYFPAGTHDLAVSGESVLFSKAPLYAAHKAWESVRPYSKNKPYLYGLDGAGFTGWVYSEAGWPAHDTPKAMINQYGKYGNTNHVYSHRRGKEMPPYEKVAATLQVGDLLVTSKGSRHVLMFIGTLRDYGYTAETAPELAEYLDYTLVIHCGPNPDYATRMQTFLDEQGDDAYYKGVNLPSGGVAVAVIGMDPTEAPHRASDNGTLYSYFDLDGYRLMVWDLEAASYFCWFRIHGI